MGRDRSDHRDRERRSRHDRDRDGHRDRDRDERERDRDRERDRADRERRPSSGDRRERRRRRRSSSHERGSRRNDRPERSERSERPSRTSSSTRPTRRHSSEENFRRKAAAHNTPDATSTGLRSGVFNHGQPTAYWYLSDDGEEEEGEVKVAVKVGVLEAQVEAVDSVATVCHAVEAVRRWLAGGGGGGDEKQRTLLVSLVRKCCMYFSADVSDELLRFLSDHKDAHLTAGRLDQVVAKYLEKVVTSAKRSERSTQLIHQIAESTEGNTATVDEFLRKER